MEDHEMTEGLRIGKRYWCWWMSRYLWYTGKTLDTIGYEFKDDVDCVIILSEQDVRDLEIR